VVAADARGHLLVYADGRLAGDAQLPSRAMALRVSGSRVVAIPTKRAAAPPMLVDLEAGRAVALIGHVGRVFSARWIGEAILTTGEDGTARSWNGRTGRPGQVYAGAARALGDATLSPDGAMVAAVGMDGAIRFWSAVGGRPLWTMLAHGAYAIGIQWGNGGIVSRGFNGALARWSLPMAASVPSPR
jgi:hypothetical protein